MLAGDLRDLKEMIRGRPKPTPAPHACMSGVEFAMYYETLPLDAQRAVSECLRLLEHRS